MCLCGAVLDEIYKRDYGFGLHCAMCARMARAVSPTHNTDADHINYGSEANKSEHSKCAQKCRFLNFNCCVNNVEM